MSEDFAQIKRRATALFEQNPYPSALWNRDLRIIDCNNAFSVLTGISRDRAVSMTYKDIKVVSVSGEGFEEAGRYKRAVKGEGTFEFPAGVKVVVRDTIPILDETGNVENILTIYADVTKERATEAEIQARQARTAKIMDYLKHEVSTMSTLYSKMAEGDLTVRYKITEPDADTKDVHDQIGTLRDAVRGIVINLEKNIRDVNGKMTDMTSTADNANKSIEDASKGVNQIAKNASEVSDNAQKAAEGIDQMSKAMQDDERGCRGDHLEHGKCLHPGKERE